MSKSSRAKTPPKAFEQALQALKQHALLGPVAQHVYFYPYRSYGQPECPAGATLQIRGDSTVLFNDSLKLSREQWLGVFALTTLVLASGAMERLPVPDALTDLASQLVAHHWWHQLKVGELPEVMQLPGEWIQLGRNPLEHIVAMLRGEPPAELVQGTWTLTGATEISLFVREVQRYPLAGRSTLTSEQVFAQALVDNAKRTLQLHNSAQHSERPGANPNSTAAKARRWLITHFPLLGSLLTQFELVEDAELCRRMDISIAAIQISTGEIYINPARGLGLEACKFVVAHEVLHAGLNHASRRQGRDPYLWNVACDFVINDWLVGLQVGLPPEGGLLYDEALRGLPAEDIYLKLAADLRVRRRLCTLRGQDVDMLDERPGRFFTDREEFCRRALMQGLDFHQASGRGLLPAGLVEAIRVLNQPAIPWQAELAEWLQERFPLPDRHRSYARPSRRQSSTPEIPRPNYLAPEDERATRTYGVVIDTSGSMDRADMGKALGAVVAYSKAQGVKQVRLVYCDAQAYDKGYVPIESLAQRVQVRGRGGTVLQPALQWLQSRLDFPKDAPILVITDGECEGELTIQRDHAFLLSPGRRLPFVTRKPVFTMR